ncbi:hypothetical protein Poli38472_006755 [Pythium oligandrum]|uniref:Uncharacterized protein n=1 Tax=Pythium oligandrum TaxID=41045 RepID=A0A8K1FAZ9_PYTOL|nr:hypothetical protein Poli38472_006755 [Pythium oligandrum]|eukprot:TMW56745.1 hypothetical protein Poli38472_006755 [Pythium oligandrum]
MGASSQPLLTDMIMSYQNRRMDANRLRLKLTVMKRRCVRHEREISRETRKTSNQKRKIKGLETFNLALTLISQAWSSILDCNKLRQLALYKPRFAAEVYFKHYGVWGVITGAEVCPDKDIAPVEYVEWQTHDFFVQKALAQGIKEDMHLINGKKTRKAMWDALVRHKSKRDISNSIVVYGEMYACVFREDGDMEKWIRKMNGLRHRLRDLGEDIDDDRYARILQNNVSRTHRNLFQVMNYEAIRNHTPLDPEEVINILLTENETVKNLAKLAGVRKPGKKYSLINNFKGKKGKQNSKGGQYKTQSNRALKEQVKTRKQPFKGKYVGCMFELVG